MALDHPLGSKRGLGRGSFIDSVLDAVDAFYGEVLQNLKAWAATPPKLREQAEAEPVTPALTSTALSSQDGIEESSALTPPDADGVVAERAPEDEGDGEAGSAAGRDPRQSSEGVDRSDAPKSLPDGTSEPVMSDGDVSWAAAPATGSLTTGQPAT